MTSGPNDTVRAFSNILRFAMVMGVGLSLISSDVDARPSGAQVARGNVTFHQHGNRTIIRASDGSIINYLNFNIGRNETVRFIQPGAWARVLNRVTGPDPSVINGRLLSNGQVYLVNPAGVYFGNGAIVDVGGITAAAGHLTDARFIAGIDKFTDLSGSVVNAGSISGNSISLFGNAVANHGNIKADDGVIAMLAGDEVVLRKHGEHISVKVDGVKLTEQNRPQHGEIVPDMTATPGVENTGTISAKQGQVMLGAGDMYSLAIRNSGRVNAAAGKVTMAAADGLIENTATGLISANTSHGESGSISVQAPSILNSGEITANAQNGQAGSIAIESQDHTYLTPGSLVSASGGEGLASGGDVLIHSYHGETAMAAGATVDVSGGDAGGNGGFAEVSGASLLFNGKADLRAKPGFEDGTILFDPHNISIQDTGSDDSFLDDGLITFDEPDPNQDIAISDEALEAITGHIILQATGSINVNQQVDLVHNNDLTLEAYHTISINASINGMNNFRAIADTDHSGGGDLFISAPLDIAGTLEVDAAGTFLNSFTIRTGGGQFYLGPVDLCVDMTLTAPEVHFSSIVNATTPGVESLTINGPNLSDGAAIFDGPVGGRRKLEFLRVDGSTEINGGRVITKDYQWFLGPTVIGADTTLTSTDAGEVRFGETLNGSHALLVETAGLTRFDGDAGKINKLDSITTDAPGTSQLGADMIAGVIDLNDPVILANDVKLTGSESVDFAQTISGNQHDLIINSPQTGFHGDATDLDLLKTDAAGNTDIEANITGNKLDFNDVITLQSDSILTGRDFIDFDQTVDGRFNLTTNSDRQVRFGGDVGGVKSLQSLTTNVAPDDQIDDNLVVIDGNLIKAVGDIRFNPDGRSEPAHVATVAARNFGGLEVRSGHGDIFMGPNEKMTSLGDLRMLAKDGSTTIGDLNAFGDLLINSPNIYIRAREGGQVLTSDGEYVDDAQASYIVFGGAKIIGTPSLIGDGPTPVFASRVLDRLEGPLANFVKVLFEALSLVNFTYGGTVLDLAPPQGPPPSDLATAFDAGPANIRDHVPLDPFAIRPMERLAIYIRSLRADELQDKLAGRELYDDSPGKSAAAPQDRTVAVNRLRRGSVLKSLDQYSAMFMKEVSPEQSVSDVAMQDQTPFIKTALSKAWKSYLDREAAANPPSGKIDPAGFRAFLQSQPEQTEALAYLDGLRGLFHEIWIMGATKLELRNSLNGVLKPIVPENMQQEQLEKAIQLET